MTNDMIQLLVNTDQNLLLYLNGFHNAFGDYFMSTFTGKWIWVPMYASILYVLLKNFNWKITLCCLTAIALTILFADQVCAISDLVHIVNNYRGGRYGFPSCHASNSFGLAFFLVFLFRKRWLSLFILLWATLNCYTRIYLGVHYPGDLIVGAIIGCCGAAFMCYLLKKTARGASFGKVKHTEITIYVGLLTTIGILVYASIMA